MNTLYMNTLEYAMGEPRLIESHRNKVTGKFVKLNYNVVDAEFILSHGIEGRSVRSSVYKHFEKKLVVDEYNKLLETCK